MVRKSLRSKAGLPKDFPNKTLYHSSLYSLKLFEQVQSERKLALLVFFSNACGILGHLFEHRFLDLQVLGWLPLNLLQHFVKLRISPINNFLAGVMRILLENGLSLTNNLPSAFHGSGRFPISDILDYFLFYDFTSGQERKSVGLEDILVVEKIGSENFINEHASVEIVSVSDYVLPVLNILNFEAFACVHGGLLEVWSNCIKVYTDGSLKGAGSVKIVSDAAAYFPATDIDIGVRIQRLLFSTLAKLQAIALVLECILFFSITYCQSHQEKNIFVRWVKVKKHSRVLGNVKANKLAKEATSSLFFLPVGIQKCFLVAENTAVLGNTHHFVHNLFWSVCYACWKAGPGYDIVPSAMIEKINWVATSKVWHPNSHMLFGFTTVYKWLPITVKKRLYNVNYSGVLCLLCGEVEMSDHTFVFLVGSSCLPTSTVLHLFLACFLDADLFTAVYKDFVLKNWYAEAALAFEGKEKTILTVIEFVRFVVELFCAKVWLVRSKHRVDIKKAGLVRDGGVVLDLFIVWYLICQME
ncbi:hypothetical protein G9A89_006041 [Geosiphon pyriformis]|nr:hypothetical protein G9A89_006041 [Geosiphon pyriformis]